MVNQCSCADENKTLTIKYGHRGRKERKKLGHVLFGSAALISHACARVCLGMRSRGMLKSKDKFTQALLHLGTFFVVSTKQAKKRRGSTCKLQMKAVSFSGCCEASGTSGLVKGVVVSPHTSRALDSTWRRQSMFN